MLLLEHRKQGVSTAVIHNICRYFMVFKNRELNADGAYTMDRFLEVMREL